MSEEKVFSIEETLVDLMGFAKKFGITAIHSMVFPFKIVQNTLIVSENGPASVQAKKVYISHFFYFVLCVLITMSYYRVLIFDNYNHIDQSVRDIILLSKEYLTGTSMIEKLISCLLFIAAFYLLILLLSETLVLGLKEPYKERTKRFFKRVTYFFAAASLLILLIPFLLSERVPESYIKWLNHGAVILMLTNFLVGFRHTSKNQIHRLKALAVLSLLVIWFIPTLCTFFFTTELKFLGNLEYKYCVEALNEDGSKTIVFSIDSNGNQKNISGKLLLHNTSSSQVLVDSSFQLLVRHKERPATIDTLNFSIGDSLKKTSKWLILGENECVVVPISSVLSKPLPAGFYLNAAEKQDTFRIIYFPRKSQDEGRLLKYRIISN